MSQTVAEVLSLYKEWSQRNTVHPNSILTKSSKVCWWICELGHEWEAPVYSRTSGKGCPYCSNRKVLPGFNDLATTHPDLVSELVEPETAGNVTAGSGKKLWWKCQAGHEWETEVRNRVAGKGCVYCAGKRIVAGFNDLATKNPDLVSQWHPIKNGELTPRTITAGSNRKVWWVCEEGHEWEATVVRRSKGQGCPYCAGNRIQSGYNDLLTIIPEIQQFIHQERNEQINLKTLTKNSPTELWWVCGEGHEWEEPIVTFVARLNCLYCSGKKVLPGMNDLTTTHPKIAGEWHPTKNHANLTETHYLSRQKVWWLGECGHEWQATVKNRAVSNQNCPYCAGRYRTGSLATEFPELLREWHPTKNLTAPTNLSPASGIKTWWLCSQNHEWEARVSDRTKYRNTGCPYCNNRLTVSGFNDLLSQYPDIAAEFDVERNVVTNLSEVNIGSTTKYWWQCANKHAWMTSVRKRTLGTGCPVCSKRVSQAEETIQLWMEHWGLAAERNNCTVLNGKELDIYIPEKQVAIEFNGLYWHTEEQGKHRTYHYDKWLQCKQKGIQLVQIWEDEWVRNPDQVKRMLAHKLGVSQVRKVFARKTQVVTISKTETERFLNFNHIQGHGNGSYYLGLEEPEKQELVAVLVLKKEAGTAGRTLNIIRYATSCNVVGGFTKLLKHAERTYKPERFITFSDHCVSDGGLYEKNGFTADKELPPDYMYVVKGERKHKFGYRLKKFRDDPNLLWEEGLTERELARLNNLPRIWDAGKTRWVKPADRHSMMEDKKAK